MIAIGDKVRIIRSPYSSILIGTIAIVLEIKLNYNGKGQHLYVLDLPCSNFWWYEIQEIIK